MKPEQERHRSNSRDTFFEIGIFGVSMEGKVALLNPRRTEAAPLALEKDKEVMKELEGKRGEDGLEPENACLRPTPALSCSSFTGVIDDGHAGEMNVSSGMRLCGRLERVLDSPYYGHEIHLVPLPRVIFKSWILLFMAPFLTALKTEPPGVSICMEGRILVGVECTKSKICLPVCPKILLLSL